MTTRQVTETTTFAVQAVRLPAIIVSIIAGTVFVMNTHHEQIGNRVEADRELREMILTNQRAIAGNQAVLQTTQLALAQSAEDRFRGTEFDNYIKLLRSVNPDTELIIPDRHTYIE